MRGEKTIGHDSAFRAAVDRHPTVRLLNGAIADGSFRVSLGLDRDFRFVFEDYQIHPVVARYLRGLDLKSKFLEYLREKLFKLNSPKQFPIVR